jgi:hypothetical protein
MRAAAFDRGAEVVEALVQRHGEAGPFVDADRELKGLHAHGEGSLGVEHRLERGDGARLELPEKAVGELACRHARRVEQRRKRTLG